MSTKHNLKAKKIQVDTLTSKEEARLEVLKRMGYDGDKTLGDFDFVYLKYLVDYFASGGFYVEYDTDTQQLTITERQNARTNIQVVSKETDDTRTGALTNEGKVTVNLDEASAALPIVEIKQQGVTKHVFTGDEARIIPHLLRVNSPIAPTVRGASFRGSTNGGDPIFEIQNAAGTKIFYPRGTGGIGQLRSNASDESIRRDENYLTFPATVAGTGKLNDVALADGVGMVKFAATVTEVSGIVSNNADQKELLVWTDNTDGITLTEQDTDSVAANRFLRQINVPYRTPVRVVYESSTGRWVNGNTGELQETDARYFELVDDVLTLKYILPDIAALQAFVRGPAVLAYVSDPVRGGFFNYVADADFVGSPDFGISFPAQDGGYWVRDYSGDVDLNWFPISSDLVANDSPYLQSACDSGNSVDIKGAQIRLGSAIALSASGIKIYDSKGTGKLVRNNNGMFFLTNGQNNLVFEKIRFEGDTISNYVVAGVEVIEDSNNVLFEKCTFYKTSQCVFLKASNNIRVNDCNFMETGYGVLQHNGTLSNNVFVTNNFIKDYHLDFVECNSATVETANWVIDGNICEGGFDWPTNFQTEGRFVGLTNISNVVITNNVINKTLGDNAIHIEGTLKHCVISNNLLDNCVTNSAGQSPYITIHGLANDERLKKFIITNNIFKRSDNTLPIASAFVSGTFSRIARTILSNNYFESEGNLSGLFFVTNSQQDLLVTGNKFINCPKGMEGIGLQRAQLTNNYFVDCALPMDLTQVRNCQISINSFIGTIGDYDIDSNVNSSGATRPQNNSIVGNFFSKGLRGKDANYNIVTNNYFQAGAVNNWGIAGNFVPGYGNIFSNNKYGDNSNANEDLVGRYDRRVKIYPGIGPANASGIPVLSGAFIEASTTFAVGDKIINMSPDSVKAMGWVCITAGAAGVAEWVEFGGIVKPTQIISTGNRILIAADKGFYTRFTTSPGTITIPDSVFSANDEIIGEVEVGTRTFAAGAGVTLRVPTGYDPVVEANGRFSLKFKSESDVQLTGNLVRSYFSGFKFWQTLANVVTVTGVTKTTILDITGGSLSFSTSDMSVGSRYECSVIANVTWTAGNNYQMWLNLGELENIVAVSVNAAGTDLQIELRFQLVFYDGADASRNVSWSGSLSYISDTGSLERVAFLFDRVIDATASRTMDIMFDGSDATNEIETVDILMKKLS